MATTEHDAKGRFTSSQNKARPGFSNFRVIAGAAGAGAALSILAMIGRKVAVQAPTYLAGEWDEALAAEHKAVLKIFDALEVTGAEDGRKRSMLLMQLKHALAKHALQEENVVYPALREAGKKDAADELNKEHGYVKQYLYELENMPKGSTVFLPKVAQFRRDIEAHMREEENDLFPKLKSSLNDIKSHHLTTAMNKEGFKLA